MYEEIMVLAANDLSTSVTIMKCEIYSVNQVSKYSSITYNLRDVVMLNP